MQESRQNEQSYDTIKTFNDTAKQQEIPRTHSTTSTPSKTDNQLSRDFEILRNELCMKTSSIIALKSFIAELHVEIQKLQIDNLKTKNSLRLVTDNLQRSKKLVEWYKTKTEAGKLNLEQKTDSKIKDLTSVNKRQEEETSENYKDLIQRLTSEINAINKVVAEQQIYNEKNVHISKTNSKLNQQVQEQEMAISNLKDDKLKLQTKFQIVSKELKDKTNNLMQVVNLNSQYKLRLDKLESENEKMLKERNRYLEENKRVERSNILLKQAKTNLLKEKAKLLQLRRDDIKSADSEDLIPCFENEIHCENDVDVNLNAEDESYELLVKKYVGEEEIKLKVCSTIEKEQLWEEIKHLRAMVKVKELRLNDKQTRYTTNIHTLLKNVRIYKRKQLAAEKQKTELQDTLNELNRDRNTTPSPVACQKLNKEVSVSLPCPRCSQLADEITGTRNEIETYKETVTVMKEELVKCGDCNAKLEMTLERHNATFEELNAQFTIQNGEYCGILDDLQKKLQQIQDLEERNLMLGEEQGELKSKLEEREKEMESTHSKIQFLQAELDSLMNEKYFLQRLCSDSKLALHTAMNQNKILKQRLQSEARALEFSSLPVLTNHLPHPSKSVDESVMRLLEEAKQSRAKPIVNLDSCLNMLKEDMVCLRKTVMKKAS